MSGGYHRLARYVSAFPSVRVLCLGDIMLDRYVYGRVNRVSAEAPVPIMAHESDTEMLGAVGNVARNVVALGGHARITSIVGDDDGARTIRRLISEEEHFLADLVTVSDRRTTMKIRFVARGQQLMRADVEETRALDSRDERRVIDAFQSSLLAADVVLLSDYAKGCLGGDVVPAVIEACRAAGKPVIADPKSRDFRRYNGVDLIKPNAGELAAFTGIECVDDEAAVASARKALDDTEIGAILVTRSEQGMTLVQRDGEVRHFREKRSEVFDVSGAGDTALAVVGLALGAGASLAEATLLANKTCNVVISKVGTAVVHANELIQVLQAAELETAGAKIDPPVVIFDHVARWRAAELKIGFTNGCFDLIHAGHVSLLAQARQNCDRLIVGLNTDASVRKLKGEDRPINNQTARAIVLASLAAVDAVVLFDEDTPMKLIESIRPDVLIKGADYGEDQVVGAEFVKSYGGRVFLAQLAPEVSTTRTIDRIKG